MRIPGNQKRKLVIRANLAPEMVWCDSGNQSISTGSFSQGFRISTSISLSEFPRFLLGIPFPRIQFLDHPENFSSTVNIMPRLSLSKLVVSLTILSKFSMAVPAEISARAGQVETTTVSLLISFSYASRVNGYLISSLKMPIRHLSCLCRYRCLCRP